MFKNDLVEPKLKFEFVESDSEVDGQHVLAKVRGVFFCPDGMSRNRRFYPKALWEKALLDEDVQRKLRSKTMFGTIGHDTELNDKTLQEGKISHIVTKAYIDEQNQGIGEALILNTPSGQILNTVLRAGSEVYVSSRADGKFKGNKNGVPVVDEDSYVLKGWDFVLSPGFLQANPTIAEEYRNTIKGENQMDELLKKAHEEQFALREKLLQKDFEVKGKIEEALKPIEEENAHIKKQLHEAEQEIADLEDEKKKVEELLAKFMTLGENFENVEEALKTSFEFMNTVHEEFGTLPEIREAMTRAVELKEEFDRIGSIEEVKACLDIAQALIAEKKEAEDDKKADDLADKLDVKAEAVKKMMKRGMSEAEIEDILKSAKKDEEDDKEDDKEMEMKEKKKKMKESDDQEADKKDDKEMEMKEKKKKKYESDDKEDDKEKEMKDQDENLGEAALEDKPKRTSRAMRLMEALNR